MDQTELQEKIVLYYQKLPEETKVLFAGMSWLETLKEIDTKYSLNDAQIETLGTETTILLLGIISLEDYVQTIKDEIKLEGTGTDNMLDEIGDKILKDIAPLLYESYEKNVMELEKENVSTDTVPLPPYAEKKQAVEPKVNPIINSAYSHNNETDMYREHGIDVISNDYPQTTKMDILKKQEELQEEKHNDNSNIIANKLFNNTASQKVVTDYSIPKVNPLLNNNSLPQGGISTKPHDPYHEEI
ncbi:hypothetical protein A2467_02650 [Candidatus Nomurabacteria bacterium RIFOXYC2_FULL_36_8]|nr:MAG: hypothetical protein UR97_C0006G0014 [Candidatus Nomurabacteria bacterium GW2011_GWE2_36_115]KKP93535.1 MAG: hypothetical protein US00_C0006G0015 [Candidatus Nomurabacteria bacterium GW2011_GWF2_36_126]KKP97085.1 MAG: hypothetical protein US04_C0001G0588 [Candidatus Nomurabacteria bacterium GW2011_GWD2_36_14]KKP98913.1 MAG: hypothetical protein US08_C0005G0021 [Candidatus Nomurabacteria bacterium GW2011_GWF2_36_19]KKQ05954.1 MAG: hypothetical protein US17_C0001G0132 [Candidatus Nomuraba